jgi:hypothetical protein
VCGFSEHSAWPFGSIKIINSFDQLRNYRILMEDCVIEWVSDTALAVTLIIHTAVFHKETYLLTPWCRILLTS